MRATAIWMRTAFSEVPRKRVILRVCLTQRKNSSIGPAALVEIGDLLGGGVEVVATEMRSTLPVSVLTRTSRTALVERVAAAAGLARGQEADAVGEDVASSRHRQLSATPASGVLDLKRVTMRQPAASSSAHQA